MNLVCINVTVILSLSLSETGRDGFYIGERVFFLPSISFFFLSLSPVW